MIDIIKNESDYFIFSCSIDDLSEIKSNITDLATRYKESKTNKFSVEISMGMPIKNIVNKALKEIQSSLVENIKINNNLQYFKYSFVIAQGAYEKNNHRDFKNGCVHIDFNILNLKLVGLVYIENEYLRNDKLTSPFSLESYNYKGFRGSQFFLSKNNDSPSWLFFNESLKIHGYGKYITYYSPTNETLDLFFDDKCNIKIIAAEDKDYLETPIGVLSSKNKGWSRARTSGINENTSLREILSYYGIYIDRRGWKKEVFATPLKHVNWEDVRITEILLKKIFSE